METSMTGYLKLWRDILEHAVWTLPDSHLRLWFVCLILANFKDNDWWDGSQRIEIKQGSFITSQDSLAKYARLTRNQIRKGLLNLERIGSIRTKTRTKSYTAIEIVNWLSYQGNELPEHQEQHQGGTKREPREHQEGTITEEGKEGKKERKKKVPCPPQAGGPPIWPSPESLALKYNQETPDNLPAVSVDRMKGARREATVRILRLFPDVEFWTRVFQHYHHSRFLRGLTPKQNGHDSFKADFDWLISRGKDRIENCLKVHDGRYRDEETTHGQRLRNFPDPDTTKTPDAGPD